MGAPWLSVVMPTYNGSRYISDALDSILAQADDCYEVIVVDDGSTDRTLDIVESYATRMNMKIVSRSHTGNWVANTNYAMAQANGEYICWLHQDDKWCEDRLRILKQIITHWPDADFVLHPSMYINSSARKLGTLWCPVPQRAGPITPEELTQPLLIQNFICSGGTLFRASAVKQLGGCDESLWYLADWDLWLKLGAARPTVYCPKPLTATRLHAESQTMRRATDVADFRNQYERVLDRHFDKLQTGQSARTVKRLARFSAEINIQLAAIAAGNSEGLGALVRTIFSFPPSHWRTYLNKSKVIQRIVARLRARVFVNESH